MLPEVLFRRYPVWRFHLRHIILHLDFLHIGSIFDREFHAFSCHITIGRFCFNQCVFFSDSQLTDHMCFFTGRPFIHDISISIYHFQLTSRKFFSGCQTGFGKFYNGWLIFKGKIIVTVGWSSPAYSKVNSFTSSLVTNPSGA